MQDGTQVPSQGKVPLPGSGGSALELLFGKTPRMFLDVPAVTGDAHSSNSFNRKNENNS